MPFFVRFGDASADFLFKSMVAFMPSSEQSSGDGEGSRTGSEGREGVDFAEGGEEERRVAAERESERRAGIRCRGGSGTDWTDFTRPSVSRIGESGEETLESSSGGEEVSSTGTSAGAGV